MLSRAQTSQNAVAGNALVTPLAWDLVCLQSSCQDRYVGKPPGTYGALRQPCHPRPQRDTHMKPALHAVSASGQSVIALTMAHACRICMRKSCSSPCTSIDQLANEVQALEPGTMHDANPATSAKLQLPLPR